MLNAVLISSFLGMLGFIVGGFCLIAYDRSGYDVATLKKVKKLNDMGFVFELIGAVCICIFAGFAEYGQALL